MNKKLFTLSILSIIVLLANINERAYSIDTPTPVVPVIIQKPVEIKPAIGYVNFEIIQQKYKKFQDLVDLQKMDTANLQKSIADAKKDIILTKNTDAKKALEQKYTTTLEAQKNTCNAAYNAQATIMQKNLKATIQKIAKAKNLSVVLKGDSFVYGGIDITNDVILELNKL